MHDRLPPMDVEVVRSTIERELGGGSTCTLDLESWVDFHLIQHFHEPRDLSHKRSGPGTLADTCERPRALEELGLVFLKFGQVLTLRRDLLPDEYIAGLERLHDRLPDSALPRAAGSIT